MRVFIQEFLEIRSLEVYGLYNLLFLNYQRFHLHLNLIMVHIQNTHHTRVPRIFLQLQSRDSISNSLPEKNHQRK